MVLFGDKKLVTDRIEDKAGNDLLFSLQSDRDGELGNAVQKIGGAIQRVDDESVSLVGAINGPRLLDEKSIPWPGAGKLLDQNPLGALIGDRNEIGWSLHRDLKILEFAKIAD